MTDLFERVPEEAQAPRAGSPRKRRSRLPLVLMLVALALLVGGAAAALQPLFAPPAATDSPKDFSGPGNGQMVTITINPGDTGAAIGATLASAGVVATQQAFIDAYASEPRAVSIQPGAYTLPMEISGADAVDRLLDADSRSDWRVTIPEGSRLSAIYDRVARVMKVEVPVLEQAAEVVRTTGLPPEAAGILEGWFAAGTYSILPGQEPQQVLQAMVDRTVQQLQERAIPAAEWQTLLTKASIVEAEIGQLPAQWTRVAGVIENRLAGRCENQDRRLQMDSTVRYFTGKRLGETNQMDRDTANPYNTYVVAGLPPSAIGSPNFDIVDATRNPDLEGDYCYFVTVNLDTGEAIFTRTFAEHEVYVAQYRQWLIDNPHDG